MCSCCHELYSATFGDHSAFAYLRSLHRGKGASLALDAYMHKNQGPSAPGAVEDGDRNKRPHGVFHAHAHDMQYLEQWLGDMLDLKHHHTGKANGRDPSQQS